jgi:uroporphyrinogen decarboxylase
MIYHKIYHGGIMTGRERFILCAAGEPADRGVFWEDRLWDETRTRWIREGMDEGFDFSYDFRENECHKAVAVSYGYLPPFEEKVLEELGNKKRVIDQYGVEKLIMKDNPNLQHFIKYPVENRSDWEKLAPRLDADAPGRFAKDWIEKAQGANAANRAPLSLGGGHLCGFFSFLRETMGDNWYYLIYDEPDMVREMLDFQEQRICRMIRKVTAEVQIDRLFIWEDMCFKTGPLIGPEMFRELIFPHYAAVTAVARECSIPVIDVDSDGLIDALLPLWIEAGVTMLHPFEVQAGMDVNRVRKFFGYNFAMRGGVDKRALAKEKKDIDAEIERIRPAYEGGRYIPCVDHSVPPDVSFYNYQYYIEKLKAMLGV